MTDLIRRRPDRGSNAGGGSGACAGDYENNVGLFEFDVDDPDFITTSPTSPSASVNVTSNMAHSNARNAVVQRCANYNNLNSNETNRQLSNFSHLRLVFCTRKLTGEPAHDSARASFPDCEAFGQGRCSPT